MDTPDEAASVRVRRVGHGTGVHHVHVDPTGAVHIDRSAGGKLLPHPVRIVLVGLAAEGLEANPHMESPASAAPDSNRNSEASQILVEVAGGPPTHLPGYVEPSQRKPLVLEHGDRKSK